MFWIAVNNVVALFIGIKGLIPGNKAKMYNTKNGKLQM